MNTMEPLNLQIGSPVFIMSKSDKHIYPGIVYKKTTDQTIGGEKVVWMIMVGPENNRKVITSEELEDFQVYKNLYELKKVLFKQVIETVETRVKEATSNLKTWYEKEIPLPVLAQALKSDGPPKEKSGFKSIGNATFAELAGPQAAKELQKQAAEVVKATGKRGRPPKQRIELPPIEQVLEQNFEQTQEAQAPLQPNEDGSPKIRIKTKLPDGTVKFIDADDLNSVQDIEF